ncbi:1,4-dihydroxy-2-naphthoate polyprenyltransferase [Actinomycetospora sp. NBRC 106378]|jgi:1,4-dihydroxy-2-naphthoate polyprenyltransferase|uniref:1,4-dihydroxy-2-naphthoate polyprenyltransferase n=1 Tax=Actinomycetospora sp. NBRC 106378 TaxID=3032208 RepID=UPI0024A12CE0|nr:1,4-dihydroxy-2-naphthoate polyprenyltransferase [Actinomycetospora sp. NBRC 106378]GLZ50919.1 1,4-dihydroxy-2-naphthoate octaprenyltransferase [Actinomycetospora sp. NBRC 106378]
MATVAEWVEGARPRTLPNAIAPVVAGSGAAASSDGFHALPAVLALLVAMGMVIGVNFANDYSDGIRGTDDERVGPMRLVGSRAASPGAVRRAAFVSLGIGALAGVALLAVSGAWWLLLVGAVCLAGAWFYTGGSSPYGYRGLGEVAVFLFFGPVAVLGTEYTQSGRASGLGIGTAVGVGLLSCAVLVANNLRDVPSDTVAGKRTLAVLLGERDTRVMYAALVVVPLGMSLVLSLRAPWALLGLVSLVVLVPALRRVLGGARGPALIPVLRDTGLALLVWAIGTAVGLSLVS